MSNKEPTTTVLVSKKLHRKLKRLALDVETSLSSLVERYIENGLRSDGVNVDE